MCRVHVAAELLFIGGVFALFPAAVLAGPTSISLVSQTREVSVIATQEFRHPDPDPTTFEERTDTDSASDFGPANLSASASWPEFPNPGGDAFTHANATMTSTISDSSLDASGAIDVYGASDNSTGNAKIRFEVTFDVLSTVTYTTATRVAFGGPGSTVLLDPGQISLTKEGADPIFTKDLVYDTLDPETDDTLAVFNETGELQPGRYTFSYFSESETDVGTGQAYTLGLTFVDTPTAVPLPAAFWPGLAMLLTGGTVYHRRRAAHGLSS